MSNVMERLDGETVSGRMSRIMRDLMSLKSSQPASGAMLRGERSEVVNWSGSVPSAPLNALWRVNFTADDEINFVPFAQMAFDYAVVPRMADYYGITIGGNSDAFDEFYFWMSDDYASSDVPGVKSFLIHHNTEISQTVTLNVVVYSAIKGSVSIERIQ